MVNINTVYVQSQLVANKSQSGGYLSPKEFNQYAPMASTILFNQLAEEFQRTQKITDSLKTFITPVKLLVDSNGRVNYPSDYGYLAALRSFNPYSYLEEIKRCGDGNTLNYNRIKQQKVTEIDNSQLGIRLNSPNFYPSQKNPIATVYEDFIQCYPVDLGILIMDYLRLPVTPVWGYTIDAVTGLPVYNPATSTDFDWASITSNQLTLKVCNLFGIEIRETDLIQMSNAVIQDN